MTEPIIIRRSTNGDRLAIVELAALDSRRAPQGDALLAFSGTELRAALPLDGEEPIADPFHHTAELVDLLRVRTTHALQRRDRRAAWRALPTVGGMLKRHSSKRAPGANGDVSAVRLDSVEPAPVGE